MTCKVYHIPNGYANTYIVFAPNHQLSVQLSSWDIKKGKAV